MPFLYLPSYFSNAKKDFLEMYYLFKLHFEELEMKIDTALWGL